MPHWSDPICGSARSTTSPFISNTNRETPWAAGCWGPKFKVKFLICLFLVVMGKKGRNKKEIDYSLRACSILPVPEMHLLRPRERLLCQPGITALLWKKAADRLTSANYYVLYRLEAREILRYSAATREGSFMLGVQTYYARAASPAHLLYPLTLHTTSSYLLYLIESRSITIQDNKKARKKRIAIALGGGGR